MSLTAKDFDENFEVVFEQERLWCKCKKCGKLFSQDTDLHKLSLEILKHQFIVES